MAKAKIQGTVSSDQTTFLFKLLHQLLPTQDRLNRITNEPGICKICRVSPEDLYHAFFSCPSSQSVADLLLSWVQIAVPGLEFASLLRLEFGTALEEEDQLATLCLISTGLHYMWQARAEKKVLTHYKMRAELEAMITILRKMTYNATAVKILEMII